jgi:membrane-associated protein
MISPNELFTQLSPPAVYALIFGLVVLEGILVIGPFCPTTPSLLIAGFLAHAGTLYLPIVVVCAASGAVIGDAIGYHTGRRLGSRLRNRRLGRRAPESWDRASALINRRGGPALLGCRFVPIVRTVAPHLVGAAGMPYRSIVAYSLAAGTAWACTESGIGYLAGSSYDGLIAAGVGLMPVAVVVGLVICVLGAAGWRRRARRARANRPHRTDRDADTGVRGLQRGNGRLTDPPSGADGGVTSLPESLEV